MVLENYASPEESSEYSKNAMEHSMNKSENEAQNNEDHISPQSGVTRVPSWREIVNDKGEVNVTGYPQISNLAGLYYYLSVNNWTFLFSARVDATNPCFWSRVCLHNMAKLGKEATSIRRVLESLFRYFDNGNLWAGDHGLAFTVLNDMQFLMEQLGT